jgi:catechol 2,3-dioxygenase-like lactoylglutathione lyase family enzyme
MSYTLKSLIPQLPILNMEAAKKFYTEELNCRLESEYPDFLIFEFEGLVLHLWLCDSKAIPESSSFYAIVENIEEMYARYAHVKRIVVPLCTQPWGMKEFYIMDNSGNLLKFGERAAG